MKKTKTIRHSDPRPRLRNALRAADEFMDRKKYIPEPERKRGPGPDDVLTEGCDVSNIETFTRVEATGLGTSEFGPDWLYSIINVDPLYTIVNGTQAHFRADDNFENAEADGTYSVGLWETGLTPPVELLLRTKFRWQKTNGGQLGFLFGFQSGENWDTSTYWSTINFSLNEDFGADTFTLQAEEELSFEEGFTTPVDIAVRSYAGQPDSTWYEIEWWTRYRLNSDGVKARFWETSASEPGTWQIDNTSTPNSTVLTNQYLGLTLFNIWSGSEFFGNNSEVYVDSIEVTVGAIDPICDQQQLTSISVIYAVQAFGPESPGAAQIPGILGQCTRISDTQYDLPSDALYVKNVYIDGMQLSGAMWNFVFNSGNRITFLSAVASTSEVLARYVPVA